MKNERNAVEPNAAPLEGTADLGAFKPRKVNISEFTEMKDQTLSTKVKAIVTAMTDNADFDKPEPTLADITARNTAFMDACANYKVSGSDINKGIRDNARKVLLTGIRSLAAYVEVTSKGNPILIKSVEFTPYAERINAEVPGKPPVPLFKQGKKLGEGKLSTLAYKQNSKRAKAVWQMSLDNGKTYVTLLGYSAPTNKQVTDLPLGQQVWFCCAYVVGDLVGDWSDPCIVVAQMQLPPEKQKQKRA